MDYNKEKAQAVIMRDLLLSGWSIDSVMDQMERKITILDDAMYRALSWVGVAVRGEFKIVVLCDKNMACSRGAKYGNPKGSNWHIEKDGDIISKGRGLLKFHHLFFSSRDNKGTYWKNDKEGMSPIEGLWDELNAFIVKINTLVGNTTKRDEVVAQLKAIDTLRDEQEAKEREDEYKRVASLQKEAMINLKYLDLNLKKGDILTAREMSKSSTLGEVLVGDSSYGIRGKIEEVIEVSNNQYDTVCDNLMSNYDFLDGKGGSLESDDGDYEGESLVMLKSEDARYLIVNPHGYSYARYVVIPGSIALMH
jgi:hypothetical protein